MMAYHDSKHSPKSIEQVIQRIEYLRELNRPSIGDRSRIRALMNGGRGAIEVLLNGYQGDDHSLPAANHIASGIERFSEMIAPMPALRIDGPEHNDNDAQRKSAEKRTRIVSNYDRLCDLQWQMDQVSMWLPGYGFAAWRIKEGRDRNGHRYPKAELRDPYSTWPSEWGADHAPHDAAFQRTVPHDTVEKAYPKAQRKVGKSRGPGQAIDTSGHITNEVYQGWDGSRGGCEVIEYIDSWGIYVYSPHYEGLLDRYEHPLNRPPFVFARRINFDQLQGQFTNAIGLASVMAKHTLLTQIAMEDAVFAPVIVQGRMDQPFRKGRDAVNIIEGGGAQYLQQNLPYQMFQEIDRIDRHTRTATGYSQQVDGESPMSFVTGAGLEELGSSVTRQVDRYQRIEEKATVELDAMRLEWDEVAYGYDRKALDDAVKGGRGVEHYVPANDIKGNYRTRRVYGLMASWDEPRKLVGGLQLLSAGVIDQTTLRENLSGLDNIPRIEERQRKDQAQTILFQQIAAMAEAQDPRALAAMLEVHKTGDIDSAIEQFFMQEDEPEDPMAGMMPDAPPGVAEMMGMLGGGGGPGGEGDGQVLSRLTGAGRVEGGAQTVNEMGAR